MNAQSINIIISAIASAASLLIARSAWQRRHTPGARWFLGLVLCISWVTFWYVLEAISGFDVNTYVTLSKIEYLGLTYIPLFWLGFALTYSGAERPVTPRAFRLLVLLPLVTIILAWTNDWHGLIWQVARLVNRNGIPIFEPTYGAWFWVYMVYSYTIFLIGSFVLARQALGTWRLYRAQAILLLIGTTLPWISNLLQIFDDLNPFPGIYVNALFLSTSMLALAVGLFRLRLLDIVPLARETILENIPVGFVVVDVQARIVAFNQYIKPYLSHLQSEPIGRLLAEVFPSLPPPLTDSQFFGELRWHTQTLVVEITVTPVIDWRGNRRGQLLVFNDVTARVQAQQALEESEKRQRALLEALPDLMFRIRGDGTYLDYHAANPGDLLMAPEAFIGRRVSDIMPPEIAVPTMNHIETVLKTGSMAAYEYAVRQNKKEQHFEARIVASGSDEVVAIIRDIDARKQAEHRALALALERERISMISRFIQDTTHEFRTPLSVIRMSLHLLQRVDSAEKREERARQIEDQVTRLARLVDMLVKMSALDGEVHLAYRPTNLNLLIELLDNKLSSTLPEGSAVLKYELQQELPLVQLDPERMMEAVQELIDNALRHTSAQESVTLRTYSNADGVTLEVQDTGEGIAPDALPRLFERFYRQDGAHSTPGFGLGLSIAQRIVELHGGKLEVQSTPGIGSRFMIHLPFDPRRTLENRAP
ncbi:MAG: histidine kinase N-terminal 7TM domain-containing protein [Chloroflexota bacterium]